MPYSVYPYSGCGDHKRSWASLFLLFHHHRCPVVIYLFIYLFLPARYKQCNTVSNDKTGQSQEEEQSKIWDEWKEIARLWLWGAEVIGRSYRSTYFSLLFFALCSNIWLHSSLRLIVPFQFPLTSSEDWWLAFYIHLQLCGWEKLLLSLLYSGPTPDHYLLVWFLALPISWLRFVCPKKRVQRSSPPHQTNLLHAIQIGNPDISTLSILNLPLLSDSWGVRVRVMFRRIRDIYRERQRSTIYATLLHWGANTTQHNAKR